MSGRDISSEDIWFGQNQPYGYWRVGNPVVKLAAVGLLMVGAFGAKPSIVAQGAVVIGVMLWLPFSRDHWSYAALINFGVGGLLVYLVSPDVIPYQEIHHPVDIPGVATVDLLLVVAVLIVFLAFYEIAEAVTTRDLVWVTDLVPDRSGRRPVAAWVYASVYGLVQFRPILQHLDWSVRSRGLERPTQLRTVRLGTNWIDLAGVWLLNLVRKVLELEKNVEFQIGSRIKLDRERPSVPIWRSVSATDISIAGIIVGIIIMRIM